MDEQTQEYSKIRTQSLARDVQFKVIVLGLAAVGKSSITTRFLLNIFPEDYIPTLQDTHRKTFMVDNKITSLEILDTAGMEEYQLMQELWIKEGNGFILVYSVQDPDSLDNLNTVYQKIEQFRSEDRFKPPVFIVQNKIDISEDKHEITEEQGIQFAESLDKDQCHHIKTSAKTGQNVEGLFHSIVRKMRIIQEQQRNSKSKKKSDKKKKKWYHCTLI